MSHLLLAAAIVIPCWLVSLVVWPYRPCTRCKGTGQNKGSTARRFGICRKCDGSRRQRRIGAKAVHRAVLALRNRKED